MVHQEAALLHRQPVPQRDAARAAQPSHLGTRHHDTERRLQFLEPADDGVVAVAERDEFVEVGRRPVLAQAPDRPDVRVEPAVAEEEAEPAAVAFECLFDAGGREARGQAARGEAAPAAAHGRLPGLPVGLGPVLQGEAAAARVDDAWHGPVLPQRRRGAVLPRCRARTNRRASVLSSSSPRWKSRAADSTSRPQ